ncbi:apolipoprotein N-acyltransferase [Paracoccus sp. S-4012]|uniref:apolipoprotein N-acyltransferase n=1 Tax=Paracoccus sp. S-4012 TaxID=2665648 RepID=UPI0012B061C5|nr:apolipoprotein N-acyltransferase [Paracoccus sp. S-4012]
MRRRDPAAPPRVSRLRLTLLELALGAAAALGHAPFDFWPATPVALGLALWHLARAATARQAGLRGLFIGAGYFAVALVWIVEPFLVEPEIHGWMAPFALVFMALGGGLFWAVPVGLAARLVRGWRARAVAMAVLLLVSEWLRGWIFTGFPWAMPGQAWVGTPVAQLAAWGGQLGLTALTLTLAVLPVVLWRPARTGLLGAAPGLAASAVLLSAAWIAGLMRLAAPEAPATGLVLRLVQPNADQALKWDPDWATEFYRRLLQGSAGPTAFGSLPDAVIWPETAVSFLLNDAGPVLPQMAEAAGGAPLLTGMQRHQGGRWFNSLVEVAPDGTATAVYDKFHLVPFGEYIPWGDAVARFGIGAFAAQNGFGYTSGPGPAVLQLDRLPPFQPLICYEAVFPQHLRAPAARPEWLLQITNDAWFGQVSGPWQHLAQAQLRAIETGLPLMRVANTGISAAIGPRGRIAAQLGLGVLGRIDAVLPAPLPPTLWYRFGDGPLLALALALLGLTVAADRRRPIDGTRRSP